MAFLTTLLVASHLAAKRVPLFVHVMPWFEANSTELGWHWRMNKTSQQAREGHVASHFTPKIGPYDMLDPDVVELQVGWIKLSGFDGVLINWYSTEDQWDYLANHRRTEKFIEVASRAGLTISLVYEDQTVRNLIREGKITASEGGAIIDRTSTFLAKNWFKLPNWWRVEGKPALMVFGPQHFGEREWARFRKGTGPMTLFSLDHRSPFAEGIFDWLVPSKGIAYNETFLDRLEGVKLRVPVAYPRFQDYYAQGGQTGYPVLPDDEGRTYRNTLANAFELAGVAVQVATWNDWQEGTQIEPSTEFGYRDLIATQKLKRQIDPGFSYDKDALDLPYRLYLLRKKGVNSPAIGQAAEAILGGNVAKARTLLDSLN